MRGTGEMWIDVRDNGAGMESGKKTNGASFGLKMVHTLIRELKGKIDVQARPGTAYRIQIPL